jgi:NAD(P)-dependent dehydrogenase (short-subunit alcohol dehydrogenase family)
MLMYSKKILNKVVIVTGASSGIGWTTAVAFAREGAKVFVAARRPKEGEETARMIEEAGSAGRFVQTDVSHAEDVEKMVSEAIHSFGRLDIAFNNVGIAENPGPFVDQPEEAFDRVMDVTVKGIWLCMKAEIPQLLKAGGGAIVNMSSIAGVVGVSGAPIYTASKHAVVGLTKATALEFAKSGIRINAICPGAIETESLEGYFRENESIKKKFVGAHPIGRLGTPEEVASAVLWLCSEDSAFMVGNALLMDGGYTVQ